MRAFALLIALVLMLPAVSGAGGGTLDADAVKPEQGGLLANFSLPYPEDPDKAAYLGLEPGGETFTLTDIKAKALLIEIFSMYCPFCQKEAPVVNEMFDKLQASDVADDLKMLGIGTGNSAYEVDVFRTKFQITMPLFPDPDFTVYNTIGQVGTPFFILLRAEDTGQGLKILRVHEGMLNDPEAFYTEMVDRTQNLEPTP